MEGEGWLEMEEVAVVVKKDEEKYRISQDTNIVSQRQHVGHMIGIVAANLTGTMPFILAGTAAGRLVGRFSDNGVTNHFINKVKKQLVPGTSALLIYARSDPARSRVVIDRLRQYKPHIVESDMPEELVAEVNAQLRGE